MEYKNTVKYDLEKMNKASDVKIADIKGIIASIEEAVKKQLSENSDLNLDRVEEILNNLLNNKLFTLNHPTRSDLYLFKTLETLLKNQNVIGDILSSPQIDEIINNTQEHFVYTSNIQDNYITVLKDAFLVITDVLSNETRKKLLEHKMSSSEIKVFQSKISKFLKQFYDKFYNLTIKQGYINKMLAYIEILDFSGTLAKNNNYNNDRLTKLNLEFLGFNYNDDFEDNIKRPVIEDLMKPEFYNNFKAEELIAMSAFYANRVAKTVETYNYCLYIIYKTGLLKKYKENPTFTFNLSDEDIQNILLQQRLFSKYSKQFVNEKMENCKDKNLITPDIIYEELDNPFIKQAIRKYENNYSDEFNEILPGYKHDILSDFGQCLTLQTSTQLAYTNKYNAIESLLLMLIDNDKERNWGVILDESSKDEYTHNLVNNFLIGVDMKEFNMPITFHCSESLIRTFINNYTKADFIPVYKGITDMIRTNNNGKVFYGTQILMKLSKEQRKLLRHSAETISKTNQSYKFIHHIQWMSHPNRPPDHIKAKSGIDKNGNLRKYFYHFGKQKVYREDKLPQLEK